MLGSLRLTLDDALLQIATYGLTRNAPLAVKNVIAKMSLLVGCTAITGLSIVGPGKPGTRAGGPKDAPPFVLRQIRMESVVDCTELFPSEITYTVPSAPISVVMSPAGRWFAIFRYE